MPHLIVEYSDNLDQIADMTTVIAAVHQAALDTGLAALDALRTRAEPRALFRIADGHVDNAFLGVIARMAPGRTPEDKQRLLDALLAAVEASLGDAARNTMLSVEYQEIDIRFRINKNNIRDAVATRSK